MRCRCLSNFTGQYVAHPDRYIDFARKMLPAKDFRHYKARIRYAALYLAEELAAHWPVGEGFGSSDMTFEGRKLLEEIGYETAFVDGLLTVVGRKPGFGQIGGWR